MKSYIPCFMWLQSSSCWSLEYMTHIDGLGDLGLFICFLHTISKWTFTQTHPIWYFLNYCYVSTPGISHAWDLFAKFSTVLGYVQKSRTSYPLDSGILKLTWLLLTPSLGFTLKGRIRILGPIFGSSPHLIPRLHLSISTWVFLFLCVKTFPCVATFFS